MDTDYLLDTSFLVVLEEELRSGHEGGATAFLKQNEAAVLHISVVTYGEFCSALSDSMTELRDQILTRFNTIHLNERIAWQFSRETIWLRTMGVSIGVNDLWIASTALTLGYPVVSRPAHQFRHFRGLTVVAI